MQHRPHKFESPDMSVVTKEGFLGIIILRGFLVLLFSLKYGAWN